MAYAFSKKRKLATFFSLIVIILLSIGIMFISTQKKFFQKKIHYKCILKTSAFLKKNNNVIMNGFPIGNIMSVNLDKDNFVEVEFYVYEKYKSHMRENIKIFPVKGFSKSMLIIEADQNDNSPNIKENSVLYETKNNNIDYLMYSTVDANISIDTLVFNIDTMAKEIINPNYGIIKIYNNIEILNSLFIDGSNLLIKDLFTNKQIIYSIEKTINYTTAIMTNTEQIIKDFDKISLLYKNKKANIDHIKNNLNYTYTNMQKLINELKSNEKHLKEIGDTFNSLSNTIQKGKK